MSVMDLNRKIIHGEAFETLKNIADKSIDMVMTSPPYDDLRDYTGEVQWDFKSFKKIAKELSRVIKDGGVIVWVVGDKVKNGNKSLTSYMQALYFRELGLNIYDVIIYEKSGSGPPHQKRYFNTYEYMFIITKGLPKTVNLIKDKKNNWGGKQTFGKVTRREKNGELIDKGRKTINEYGIRTNIWRYNNGKGFTTKDKSAHVHPAIFPEKLVEDHIMSWSNEDDIILDPFLGSGTTAVVANRLNRKWIGIEISREYCELSQSRLDGADIIEIRKK